MSTEKSSTIVQLANVNASIESFKFNCSTFPVLMKVVNSSVIFSLHWTSIFLVPFSSKSVISNDQTVLILLIRFMIEQTIRSSRTWHCFRLLFLISITKPNEESVSVRIAEEWVMQALSLVRICKKWKVGTMWHGPRNVCSDTEYRYAGEMNQQHRTLIERRCCQRT